MSTCVAALYAAAGGAPATTPAQDLVDTWASGGAGSDGFAMVFEDSAGTDAPSIYVKDSGTPANDTDINLTDDWDAFNSFLTYTSPSPKIVRQSDGNLKYCAHNFVPNSSGATTTDWTQSRATLIAGQTDSDGGSNAYFLQEDGSASQTHRAYISCPSHQAGHIYRWFVVAKASGRNIQLRGDDGQSTLEFVNFTLSGAGTASINGGSSLIISASITAIGSDWYECEIISESSAGSTPLYYIGLLSGSSDTYNGDSTSGAYIYKPQMHTYPADTTYLPTTTAARYALPIQYDSSNNAEGLLVEPASTNLLIQSRDFTSSEWTSSGLNEDVTGTATGPDGVSSSATILSDDSGGGTGLVLIRDINLSLGASTTYTYSVIMKADQLSWARLQLNGTTTPASGTGVYFNLSTGAVGTADTGHTGSVIDLGGGWYRVCTTFTTGGSAESAAQTLILPADADGDVTVDRDGTSSIVIYHAQLEVGSVPTSPIITTGATETRAVDDLGKTTSATPIDITGATSFYVKQALLASSGNAGIASCYLNATNRFSARYETGDSRAFAGADGSIAGVGSISRPGTFKTAYSQNTNKLQGATGGSLGTADTTVTLSGSNGTNILLYQDTTSTITGPMIFKEILWLPEEMSDGDKQSITT